MKAKTQKPEVMQVLNCRACGSKNIATFLELGPMPIPNGFIAKEDLAKPEKFYPLDVCFCDSCGMVQLSHVVNPKIMFENYVYIPSTSTTMMRHFDELAKDASSRVNLESGDLVVDIGSNDGTLLKAFKRHGATILGIDPATNLTTLANEQGIPTLLQYHQPVQLLYILNLHYEKMRNHTGNGQEGLTIYVEGQKRFPPQNFLGTYSLYFINKKVGLTIKL